MNAAQSEAGFGIVEVLVASVLLAVGILATLSALDGAARGAYSAQRHEQAISLAQREIERIAAIPFDEVLLDAAPTAVSDPEPNNPADPRAYVTGSSFAIKRNYHNSSAGPPADTPATEPLLVDGDLGDDPHSIAPVSQNVPVGAPGPAGAAEATVWRFVTRRDESCAVLGLGLVDLCPGEDGSRRVTVAVAMEPAGNGAAPSKPTYLSTVLTEPDATPVDLPL